MTIPTLSANLYFFLFAHPLSDAKKPTPREPTPNNHPTQSRPITPVDSIQKPRRGDTKTYSLTNFFSLPHHQIGRLNHARETSRISQSLAGAAKQRQRHRLRYYLYSPG